MSRQEPHRPHDLRRAFSERFGGEPALYRAPGRVNLIGEHTDYNDGFVMPLNTALSTRVALRTRVDRTLRAHARHFDETISLDLDDPGPTDGWAAYLAGVVLQLQGAGIALAGADLLIDGDIPLGGGLSSSASLEVALATALAHAAGRSLAPESLAVLCRRAEEEQVGMPCGIMDQFVIAAAPRGHALLLDCRSLDAEAVPLPGELALLVVDSGVTHRHREGGYADRRAECEAALASLRDRGVEAEALRDVTADDLARPGLTLDGMLHRRARHVVTENARVLKARRALAAGDLAVLGRLVDASHDSLRDDFEVSCTEVDMLVNIARDTPGVLGARMVGGGFGGCVLVVARDSDLPRVRARVVDAWSRHTGAAPWHHRVTPADPAGPEDGHD